MKTYEGSGGILHALTSSLDEGEWSPSPHGRFTPGERAPPPTVPLDMKLRGAKVGLDTVAKRKSLPLPGIELRSSSP
jgi:hypothetical protein